MGSGIMLENKHRKKHPCFYAKCIWGLTSLWVFRCVGATCLQQTGVSVSVASFWVNVSYTNPVTTWTRLMNPIMVLWRIWRMRWNHGLLLSICINFYLNNHVFKIYSFEFLRIGSIYLLIVEKHKRYFNVKNKKR